MRSSSAAALAALVTFVNAHSWVEQLYKIDPANSSFTGTPGYCRNNTKRSEPGFSDPLMVHILPGEGQPSIEQRDIPALDTTGITPKDTMCKQTQQSQFQSSENPRLQASPGSLVALRYQENGHVSLPQNQKGKQPGGGSVRVYGTTQPKSPELFLDVFGQWNEAGTGGDKRGKLLVTQNYDDGRCYQVNSGNISTTRQEQFPHTADTLMGADLWCQNNIAIPTDIPVGSTMTIYWVWDWPTEAGVDPALPNGKAEIYTTCMDVDIVAKPASKRNNMKARQAPSPTPSSAAMGALNSAAIPAYMSSLTASPAPAGASPAVSAQGSAASPQPAPSQQPAAADPNSVTNAGVASYIESAVNAAIAAQMPKIPVTVTVDVVESIISPMTAAAAVAQSTPPAAAATPAAAAAANPAAAAAAVPANNNNNAPPAAAANPQQPPAQAQAPPASYPPTASPAQASSSSPSPGPAASMPPTSLDIQPPMLSGTATPVPTSASAASAVVAAAGTDASASSSQSGTPAAAPAAMAQRGCSAQKCREKRQSRIFGKRGKSGGGQRL